MIPRRRIQSSQTTSRIQREASSSSCSSISRYHSHFGSIPVDASEYYRCSAHRHVVQHAMAKVLDGKLIHDSGLLDGDDVEHPPDTRSSDDHHVQFDLLSIASLQVAAEHAQGLGPAGGRPRDKRSSNLPKCCPRHSRTTAPCSPSCWRPFGLHALLKSWPKYVLFFALSFSLLIQDC